MCAVLGAGPSGLNMTTALVMVLVLLLIMAVMRIMDGMIPTSGTAAARLCLGLQLCVPLLPMKGLVLGHRGLRVGLLRVSAHPTGKIKRTA
jgi:hypothetical protein